MIDCNDTNQGLTRTAAEMRPLTGAEVETVGGAALFGWLIGAMFNNVGGVPDGALMIRNANRVSRFEDWVNGV